MQWQSRSLAITRERRQIKAEHAKHRKFERRDGSRGYDDDDDGDGDGVDGDDDDGDDERMALAVTSGVKQSSSGGGAAIACGVRIVL